MVRCQLHYRGIYGDSVKQKEPSAELWGTICIKTSMAQNEFNFETFKIS